MGAPSSGWQALNVSQKTEIHYMRKAIVVALDVTAFSERKKEQASEDALGELNQYLAEGWKVVHSFPMSGTGNLMRSASVVILEKD